MRRAKSVTVEVCHFCLFSVSWRENQLTPCVDWFVRDRVREIGRDARSDGRRPETASACLERGCNYSWSGSIDFTVMVLVFGSSTPVTFTFCAGVFPARY